MTFCGWPASQASGWEVYTLLPYDFAPMPAWGQNNPPLLVSYPLSGAWFSTAIKMPEPDLGGSWVQCAHLTSPYVDPNEDPYFSIAWAGEAVGTADFHIHFTSHPNGTAMAGGGPGTTVQQATAAINDLQVTPEIQVPATGVGSSWGPDRVLNINLYRGAQPPDTIAAPVNVFALRMRYKLV